MNNKIKFLSLCALTALASCSSNDDANEFNVAEVQIGNSDVEIRLSSGARTRASIESDGTGAFEAQGIGVFCLAKENLSINEYELPINWNRNIPNDHWSIWMDNVESNAVIEEGSTSIHWADPEAVYMYPTGNWHSYDFYAYHPYQPTVNLDGEVFSTDIELDGTQDVIWGRATSEAPYAFSAKYFRNPASVAPVVSFSHRFARITFTLVAGVGKDGTTTEAKTMGVKSVELINMPSKANLIIADRNNPENNGKITTDWDRNLITYELLDNDDQEFPELVSESNQGYWVTDEEQKLGQGFLIPVPEEGHTMQIRTILQNRSGYVFDKTEYPIDLLLKPGFQFEAGKSYNIKMIVNGPETVVLKATLAGWEDAGDSMIDREY